MALNRFHHEKVLKKKNEKYSSPKSYIVFHLCEINIMHSIVVLFRYIVFSVIHTVVKTIDQQSLVFV